MNDELKWSRRKGARPNEIVAAAVEVFAEQGFANAKMADVARRAGVVKGTLYRYFDTKEALFRAVVRQALVAQLQEVEAASIAFDGSLADFVPLLLGRAAHRLGVEKLPAIARMVLTESRAFPDLARVWHDELVARLLALITGLVEQAQARGEVRSGDPKLYAFSILGPLVAGVMFHEIFGDERTAPDLEKLAAQHAATILRGMAETPSSEKANGQ